MSRPVVTASEMERLSPGERRSLFEESIVSDLDLAPERLLGEARSRVEQLIAESESQLG